MAEKVKEEAELSLPTNKIASASQNPSNLIIFSKPKVGKTTLLAQLDNCLIMDLEKGSKFVDAMKVECESIADIVKWGTLILSKGRPYKYIAIDTITALEEMCIPYAEELYSKSSMGKNWFTEGKPKYGSILNLANGAGYPWLRQAFEKIIAYIKTLAPHVILLGHIKDTLLEKNGAEFTSMDLDLTGKLKRITTSSSDAIGYLYRKGDKNILSFKTTDEIACGARPAHLRNQEIEISSTNEKGEIIADWSKVFID
jgi:energy-coupling factor transporter ATP-binding protein EcfA2